MTNALRSRYRIAGWSFAALLLLTPLVAMQWTDEVNWDLTDFIFAGVLIGAVGAGLEFAARMSADMAYRSGFALALLGGFLLVWINAAVGMIGSENNDANLMYLGVLGVGIAGAVISRFRHRGMIWTMVATALAQAVVVAVALAAGLHHETANTAAQLLVLNGFFVALFLVSGWLFRIAHRRSSVPARKSH